VRQRAELAHLDGERAAHSRLALAERVPRLSVRGSASLPSIEEPGHRASVLRTSIAGLPFRLEPTPERVLDRLPVRVAELRPILRLRIALPARDHGVRADARNERGESLLHVACSNRRFDAARLLLERGADPESRSELGFTPLTTAVIDGDCRLIALLLDHGADADSTGPEDLTALMLAAMLDCVELVDLLLERGVSLDRALTDGSTALSMAIRVDAQRAAQLLLAMSSVDSSRRA
jgi:hypothetical protein